VADDDEGEEKCISLFVSPVNVSYIAFPLAGIVAGPRRFIVSVSIWTFTFNGNRYLNGIGPFD
jgi:hypothetical protein